MPIVKVTLMAGRSLEQKRDLAQRLTAALVDSLEARPESVQVHIEEMDRENVAIGGVLQVDRPTLGPTS